MDWLKKKMQPPSTATSAIEIATAGAPPDLSGTPALAGQTGTKGEAMTNATHESDSTRETPSTQDVRESSAEALDEKSEPNCNDDLTRQMSTISSDDNVVYPSGLRLVIITVSLCFAVFLVALDQTIIATAMYFLALDDLIVVRKSRTSFSLCQMSDGTGQHISLHQLHFSLRTGKCISLSV